MPQKIMRGGQAPRIAPGCFPQLRLASKMAGSRLGRIATPVYVQL